MQESMPATSEVRPLAAAEAASNSDAPGDVTADYPRTLADPRVLQILMTEHWGLLATRSLAYNETFARAGMFFTTLSAAVVALALLLSAIGPGPELQVVAIVLLGFEVVIGLTTLGRVNDASMEDFRCIQGMNRLRHAYHEVAPMVEPYLSTSRYDDMPGILSTYASGDIILSPIQGLLHGFTTVPVMVNVVTLLLIAVVGGLIASAIGLGIGAAVAVGAVLLAIGLAVSLGAAERDFRRTETDLHPRFPSPPADTTVG